MREPGGRGPRARQAGPHADEHRATAGRDAAADPRRRGVRRARASWPRRSTSPSLEGYATGGTIHVDRQQPDRLHDHPRATRARRATAPTSREMLQVPVFHVNGEDPEAVVQVDAARDGVPPALRQGRRHRHVLLPPVRPQRGRRAALHPAAHVRGRSTKKPPSARCTPQRSSRTGEVTDERGRPAHRASACERWRRRWSGPARKARGAPRLERDGAASGRRTAAAPTRTTPEVPTARAERAAARAARASSRSVPQGFHAAPEGGEAARGAGASSPKRSRRSRSTGARARHLAFATLAREGTPDPPLRAGRAARHVQPPPRGARRRARRQALHAARTPAPEGQGPLRDLRLAALRAGVLGFDYGYSPGHAPRRSCSGRRSSATSPTARR